MALVGKLILTYLVANSVYGLTLAENSPCQPTLYITPKIQRASPVASSCHDWMASG
jgi:hypothetical protein